MDATDREPDRSRDDLVTSGRASQDVEGLLARVEGARRLARRLVRDPGRADDVAQQAVLASLRAPPRQGWAPAAWLSGVVRNLVRRDARSEARRSRREHAAARPESVPSAGDLVARLEVHRLLLDAVRALDGPAREAILLRYFEGLAPREIARARGMPIATVRSHLRRGLARLRERLDAAHGGDRRLWCVAMVPLAVRHAMPVASPLVPAAAAAVVLVVGGVAWAAVSHSNGDDAPPVIAAAANEPGATSEATTSAPSAPLLAAAPKSERPESTTGREGVAWVCGDVSEGGRPAAVVRVEARGAPSPWGNRYATASAGEMPASGSLAGVVAAATSDSEGRFTLRGLDAATLYAISAAPDGDRLGTTRTLRPAEAGASSIALTVHAGRRLRARLLSARREPLAGWFSIGAESGRVSYDSDAPRAALVTGPIGADGQFDVLATTGTISGHVGAAGVGTLALLELRPWTGEKEFVLGADGGARVEGRVFTSDDAPVAGARVAVTVYDATHAVVVLPATTGADGRYAIADVPPATLQRIAVTARGFAPDPEIPRSTKLSAGTTTTADVRLRKGAVVVGRVTNDAGAPLDSIEVRLRTDDAESRSGGAFQLSATTDAVGRFRFEDLPPAYGDLAVLGPRLYSVARPAPEGAHSTGTVKPAALIGEVGYSRLREGEERAVDVVVAPAPAVRGRVVDESGRPVEAATVTASSERVASAFSSVGYLNLYFSAPTDAGGAFRFDGLPAADDWKFIARSPRERGDSEGSVVVTAEGVVAELMIRMTALAAVSGRVLGADGLPAPGVSVAIMPAGATGPGLERRRADSQADGAFRFVALARRRYVVGAASTDGSRFVSEPTAVDAETTTAPPPVELRVDATYFLSGIAVGPDAKPLARAVVNFSAVESVPGSARGTTVTTDDDGRFVARGLVSGRYHATVDYPGRETDPVVEAGARDVRLVLAPRAVPKFAEGTVVGPDGKPVASASVTLWAPRGRDYLEQIGAGTAVDGAFRAFPSVLPSPERARICVTGAKDAKGALLGTAPTFADVVLGTPTAIRLEAGRAITGRVEADDGTPAASASVSARPTAIPGFALWALSSDWSVQTDAQGRFAFAGLPAGDVVVGVAPRGAWSSGSSETVTEGLSEVVLRATKGAELAGRVVGPDGEPAASYGVATEEMPDRRVPYRRVETDAAGSFRLEGLPRDVVFSVRVSLPLPQRYADALLLPRVVDGVSASTEPLFIRLRRGVFVEGRLELPDGVRATAGEVAGEVTVRDGRESVIRFVDGTLDRATGRFRLGPMDRASVRVFYRDFSGWSGLACRAPVAVTAPATDVVVPVASGRSMTVRVSPSDAKGVVFAWNPAVDPMAQIWRWTERDGAFVLNALVDEPGTLLVRVESDDRVALREGVRPSIGSIDVALEPGASIRGRIAGPPASDQRRLFVVAKREGVEVIGAVEPGGTFAIRALPPGTYRVEMRVGPYSGGVDGIAAGAQDVVLPVTPTPVEAR